MRAKHESLGARVRSAGPFTAAALLSVVAVGAVVLMLGVMLWQGRTERLTALRAETETRAQSLAQHVDAVVAHVDVTLAALAVALEKQGDSAAGTPLMIAIGRQLPPSGCLSSFDADGRLRASSCLGSPPPVLGAVAFRGHRSGRSFTDLSHDAETGTVLLTRTVIGPDGRFTGVVQATVDAAVLIGSAGPVGDFMAETLADRHGRPLAGPALLYAYGAEALARRGLAAVLDEGGAKHTMRTVTRPDLIAAGVQTRRFPLLAVAAAPTGPTLAGWTQTAAKGLAILVLIVVGTALLLRALVRVDRSRAVAFAELKLKDQALAQTANGIVICEARDDLPIVYVNPAFERTTGYAAAEVLGLNPRFLQGDQVEQPGLEEIRAALREAREGHATLCNRRKDGTLFHNDVDIAPVRDASGRVTHFIDIQHDVTARIEAEHALEDRLRFEHTLLDTIPLPIFFKGRDGAYLGANQAFETVFGLSRRGADGRSIVELAKDGPADVHLAADAALWERGGALTYETRIPYADRGLRDVVVSKAVFYNNHAEMVGIVGVFNDVTDMKRREAELAALAAERDRARIRAEEANRSKSSFLACMSHELRTPLNAILGFSELIHARTFGNDMPRYAEYAGDIHDGGEHLLSLINDILDLSKIEAGKLDLAPTLLCLRDSIGAVVRLVRQRASDHRHMLNIDFGDTDDRPMLADERAVKQILFNLLSNAIKFTPDGGRIGISCRAVGQDAVSIAISDTGVGIPTDLLDAVLRPFERLGDSYTRNQEGTGLGLSLVDSLVKAHGATLLIESEVKRGTTVTVTLPLAQATPYLASVASPR